MTDLIVKPIPIGDNNDTIVIEINFKNEMITFIKFLQELFMNDCSGKEMYFEHVKETVREFKFLKLKFNFIFN